MALSFLLGALMKRIVAAGQPYEPWQPEGHSCASSPSRAVHTHTSQWRVTRDGEGFRATFCGPELEEAEVASKWALAAGRGLGRNQQGVRL